MKVAIVTPTIGTKHLKDCLDSVKNQTYQDIVHYVFLDGSNYFAKSKKILSNYVVKKVFLEDNTGGDGWLGHRVYASCSFLVNADFFK